MLKDAEQKKKQSLRNENGKFPSGLSPHQASRMRFVSGQAQHALHFGLSGLASDAAALLLVAAGRAATGLALTELPIASFYGFRLGLVCFYRREG